MENAVSYRPLMELLHWWWGRKIATVLCYIILLTSLLFGGTFLWKRQSQRWHHSMLLNAGNWPNISKVVLAAVPFGEQHLYHHIFDCCFVAVADVVANVVAVTVTVIVYYYYYYDYCYCFCILKQMDFYAFPCMFVSSVCLCAKN